MNSDDLSDLLKLIFRNHSIAERYYDLLENPQLWECFRELLRDKETQDLFIVAADCWALSMYCFQPTEIVEDGLRQFGEVPAEANQRFQRYMEKYDPREIPLESSI